MPARVGASDVGALCGNPDAASGARGCGQALLQPGKFFGNACVDPARSERFR